MNAGSSPPGTANERTLPTLLIEASSGAQRLSTAMRSWPSFMPSGANLREATEATQDLLGTLRDLQPHVASLLYCK